VDDVVAGGVASVNCWTKMSRTTYNSRLRFQIQLYELYVCTCRATVQILYHTRGMPERLPILLLHLGRTGISLDGEELAVHFRGDRGDLGDHVLDALRGRQGGLSYWLSFWEDGNVSGLVSIPSTSSMGEV
jgi:hypothetical protein